MATMVNTRSRPPLSFNRDLDDENFSLDETFSPDKAINTDKICVRCKYASLRRIGSPMSHIDYDQSHCVNKDKFGIDPLSGESKRVPLRAAREKHCHGDWWEEKPKVEKPVQIERPYVPPPTLWQKIKNKLHRFIYYR